MEKFKGTKGNWVFSEDIDTHYSQPVINIDSTHGIKTLATVWSGLGMSEELNIEIKANALLISKAPEMLECLQSLENDNNAIPKFMWDRIQSLIKSATDL